MTSINASPGGRPRDLQFNCRVCRILLAVFGWAVLLGLQGVPPGPAAAATESHPTPVGGSQAALDRLVADLRVPGAMAAISTDDNTAASFASGFEDSELHSPMPVNGRFLAASIGKTFVAAVVLNLANQGTLDLDTPISKWLAKEPWFSAVPNGKIITLRHLLSHSSGLINHAELPEFLREWSGRVRTNPEATMTPQEVVGYLRAQKPLFAPGLGFHYSDTNYILVGLIVENATGKKFYTLAREMFLEPLRLNSTVPSNMRRIPGLVQSYFSSPPDSPINLGKDKKMLKGGLLIYNPSVEWTGGGFATSTSDLARWTRTFYGGRALPQAYLDDLFDSVPTGDGMRYGTAVFIARTRLGKVYAHGGDIPGYSSLNMLLPDHGLAIALVVNDTVEDQRLWDAALKFAAASLAGSPRGR